MFNQTLHDILTATYPPFANWQGVPIQKNPFDLLLYQEAIYDTKPRGIIETGSMHGGSALFFADMMQLTHGWETPVHVLSVDTERRDYPDDPRLTFIWGDSVEDDVLEEYGRFVEHVQGPIMVVLDADHSEYGVARELAFLPQFVSPGQWLVVEDTSHTSGLKAVESFQQEHPEFQPVDQSRYLCTYNSWMRRA